jgi:hypothetical protein
MSNEPLGEDAGLGVLAQPLRPVFPDKCEQLRLVLPPAILLMGKGPVLCIELLD